LSQSKYTYIILGVLIISLVFNFFFLNYIFEKYEFEYLFNKFILQEKIVSQGTSLIEKGRYLPELYIKNDEILKLAFDKHVKTKEDFEPWKEKIIGNKIFHVDNFQSTAITMIDEKNKDTYVQKKFKMAAFDGDTIIFYELLPKNSNLTFPAVYIIPGSGHQGARDVINEPTELSEYYYHSAIGVELVKAGYAVYVIELRGWGERAIDVGYACDTKTERDKKIICSAMIFRNELDVRGIKLDDLHYKDAAQVLKYITNLDYIDKNRIAVSGLSYGGGTAETLSNHNPEIIRATILASGTGSFVHSPLNHQTTGHGTLLCCDRIDTTATIAPQPLYVSFGIQDIQMTGWEAQTNYTGDFLKRVYELLDADENFFYIVHEGAHEYHIPSVLHFLNQTIGKNSDNEK